MFANTTSAWTQDPMVPQPDHGASASPQNKIQFVYGDWGKPINYKLNQNINLPAPQEPIPAPPPPPNSQNIFNKLVSASSWYGLEKFQAYQLELDFQKYYNKWAFENRGVDQGTIDYVENAIILKIIKQIKTNEMEMEELIFHGLQEAPWPEDRDPKINQNMETILNQ